MQKAKDFESLDSSRLVHKLLIHVEHDPSQQSVKMVCEHHYFVAESCNMIDVDYGLTEGVCFFCWWDKNEI